MQHGLPTGLNLINALMELDRLPEANAVAACMKALASPPNTSFFVELNRKLALAHAKETGRSRTLGWIRRKPRGHRS
jgi:hypothetical protein